PNTVAGSERLAAFRAETERLGLSDEYVRQGDFSSASGYREACALLALPERPTAIVAASDLMALAALQAIREVGLEPGRDVAADAEGDPPHPRHPHRQAAAEQPATAAALVGVDLPAAEARNQQVAAESAEALGSQRDTPRLVELA